MGLFRKRREPVQVGASLVAFGAAGTVDAVQFSHDQAPREVISALAPITMVISRAVSLSGTRAHAWLTAATAHEDAATLNPSVGTSTIGELPPTDQRQPDAHGVFYVTQESKLVGTWSCAFTDDSSALRVVGALWEWATRAGRR